MKIGILLGGIIGLAAIDARAAEFICPQYKYCKDGIPYSCGNKYCPDTGTTYEKWLTLNCPAGRTCVDGKLDGNCQAGMYRIDPLNSEECATCPAGHKCTSGAKIACNTEGIFAYQGMTGKATCDACPDEKVAKLDGTGCIAAVWGGRETLTGGRQLAAGVYKFEISGGGGGSGATTCSNCGNYGSSQGGGYGEKKTFTVTLRNAATVSSVVVGLRGKGGGQANTYRVDDTVGNIGKKGDDVLSCSYDCYTAFACNDGENGGDTSLTIGGTRYVAAGGKGGKGKTGILVERFGVDQVKNRASVGFADVKPAVHGGLCQTQNSAANCGSKGGDPVKQDRPNASQHSYWSDGWAGENGYIHFWSLQGS